MTAIFFRGTFRNIKSNFSQYLQTKTTQIHRTPLVGMSDKIYVVVRSGANAALIHSGHFSLVFTIRSAVEIKLDLVKTLKD